MTDQRAPIEQAETAHRKSTNFTNRGKADCKEKPARQPQARKLTRVPFVVSRLMEFCTRRELINQTGHDVFDWPLVILKELVDNALDAAEASVAPVVSTSAATRSSSPIMGRGFRQRRSTASWTTASE